MESDVLTLKLVLGNAVGRCRELRDNVAEPAVAKVEIGHGTRPAQVDVTRLLLRRGGQRGWHRGANELFRARVPPPRAIAHNEKNAVGRLRREPVLELATNPVGCRGVGRCEQNEPLRFFERVLNRCPQVRIRGEDGLVTKHPQRARPVPGLCQPLEIALERGRELAVRIV